MERPCALGFIKLALHLRDPNLFIWVQLETTVRDSNFLKNGSLIWKTGEQIFSSLHSNTKKKQINTKLVGLKLMLSH